MPEAIYIDEQTKASIITLRRKTGVSDHEIAHKLDISEWTVIRTLREHRRLFPDDPLPAQRWSPNGRAMRRMALANRLVEENALTRREILAKTGYGSWRSLLGMVRLYRERLNLGPMRHLQGWIKATGEERVRIVLCAEAIDAACWRKGQKIAWSHLDGEIWLTPEQRVSRELANRNAGNIESEIYWERYGLHRSWREIARNRKMSPTTVIKMAERHATKHPWLASGVRRSDRGVVQVMRINESTLRLNLNRATFLLGVSAGDLVRWELRPNNVLVVTKEEAKSNTQHSQAV
jgi:hypothetical protein